MHMVSGSLWRSSTIDPIYMHVSMHLASYDMLDVCIESNYRIAGKFGVEKVWRIDSFQAFGKRKFGKLIDQPIGYQL